MFFTLPCRWDDRPRGLRLPGSGNDYPGMGRDLAVYWPEVLRRQDAENGYFRSQFLPNIFWKERGNARPSVRDRIFGQVTLGSLVCDLVRRFGSASMR